MKERVDPFVVFEYALCGIIILTTLLLKPSLTSNAFTVSFLVLLYEFIKLITHSVPKRYYEPTIMILVVALVCVIISSILLGGSFSFEYTKEYFIFASTVIMAFVCMCVPVNRTTGIFVLKANVIISFLYPICYLFFPLKIPKNSPQLYLNFANPNLTGMWILQTVLYLFLAVILLKSFVWKLISLGSLAFNFFLQYRTGARNTLISLALFLALLVWVILRNRDSLGKFVLAFVNVFPVLFIPLYLKLINPIMESGYLDFFISEGKKLDSRKNMWTKFLNKLGNYWLIGAYPKASGNAHNAYLVVLCSYGIITLFLVIFLFTLISFDINNDYRSKKNMFCLSAFLASLLMGMGEGCLFSGGMGIYILACGYLLLARVDWSGYDRKRL